MKTDQLNKARRRLAFQISESILAEFPEIERAGYDLDQATDRIYLDIPTTRAEAHAEDEEFHRKIQDLSGKSPLPGLVKGVFSRLREALNLPPEIAMVEVLKAAENRIAAADLQARKAQLTDALYGNLGAMSRGTAIEHFISQYEELKKECK